MVDGHPAGRRRSSAKADPIDGNRSHRPFVAAIIEMSTRSTGSLYSKPYCAVENHSDERPSRPLST
jgi:hypothetical protein